MDDFLFKVIDLIMTNGQYTVTAMLIAIIMFFYKHNQNLQRRIDKKDDRFMQIIDDYKNGTLSTSQALAEIKNVLTEIRLKL